MGECFWWGKFLNITKYINCTNSLEIPFPHHYLRNAFFKNCISQECLSHLTIVTLISGEIIVMWLAGAYCSYCFWEREADKRGQKQNTRIWLQNNILSQFCFEIEWFVTVICFSNMVLCHSAINKFSPPHNKDFRTEFYRLLQSLIEIFYLPPLCGCGVSKSVVMHLFL